jgi:glycosyltransferase involved in cell wall biosynthesis
MMTNHSPDTVHADTPWPLPLVGPNTAPALPGQDSASIESRLGETERLLESLAAECPDIEDDECFETPSLKLPADFRLSIVVPVYNEQKTVLAVVAKLRRLSLPKQIIIVDDGSTDGTRELLGKLSGLPELQVVLKEQNEGKGAALRTGFAHARGSVVLVQDADLEYDPREIPRLVEPIVLGDADVVYGSRFLEDHTRGSSWLHQVGNRLLTAASNLTTGLRLTDMETCYKVFRADVLDGLNIRQNRFGFEPEVTAKLARRRLTFVELPIRYHARDWQEGKKIGLRDAINALYCIVRYAWCD